MIPIETRTAQGRNGVLMPGDYVEITACHCNPPHSRYGVIYSVVTKEYPNNDPRADFLVLLADKNPHRTLQGQAIATYCRPLELRPATEDAVANALPANLIQCSRCGIWMIADSQTHEKRCIGCIDRDNDSPIRQSVFQDGFSVRMNLQLAERQELARYETREEALQRLTGQETASSNTVEPQKKAKAHIIDETEATVKAETPQAGRKVSATSIASGRKGERPSALAKGACWGCRKGCTFTADLSRHLHEFPGNETYRKREPSASNIAVAFGYGEPHLRDMLRWHGLAKFTKLRQDWVIEGCQETCAFSCASCAFLDKENP